MNESGRMLTILARISVLIVQPSRKVVSRCEDGTCPVQLPQLMRQQQHQTTRQPQWPPIAHKMIS